MNLFQPDPNLSTPAFLALLESRRKAAEQRKQEELDAITIYPNGYGVEPAAVALHKAVMSGDLRGKWKRLGQTEAEKKEAERKARREALDIVPIPEPEFDPLEDY